MTKSILTPYLDQTMDVLNRAAGVEPARLRALGFLQQRLRDGGRCAPIAEGNADGPVLRRAGDLPLVEKR